MPEKESVVTSWDWLLGATEEETEEEQPTEAAAPEPQPSAEEGGEEDFLAWLSSYGVQQPQREQPQPQQQKKKKSRNVEEEVEALKSQLFMERLTMVVNGAVNSYFQSKPYLAPARSVIEPIARTKLEQALQVKPEIAQELQNLMASGNWQQLAARLTPIINRSLDEAVKELEGSLKALGVNLPTSQGAPLTVPPSMQMGVFSGAGASEEESIGYRIPLSEDGSVEIRVVPDSYLDKIRAKQRDEYIKDRLALMRKRMLGGQAALKLGESK